MIESVSRSCTRVRYSKVESGYLVFVIVEIGPGDRAEFFCQESGEVRWFPFVPEPEERTGALALAAKKAQKPGAGWPLLDFGAE